MPDFVTPPMILTAWAFVGYFLGSIPFGILIARFMGLGDLRQIGSGNIGATNVLRTGSKLGAALTLIADAGKAGAAVILARVLATEDAAQLAGLAALFGHCYPIWLKFRGGKGVSTLFGLLFALAWPIGLAAGTTWLIIAAIFRYSSLAALMTALFTPLFVIILTQYQMLTISIAITFLIFWRHRGNICRIISLKENKIGQK